MLPVRSVSQNYRASGGGELLSVLIAGPGWRTGRRSDPSVGDRSALCRTAPPPPPRLPEPENLKPCSSRSLPRIYIPPPAGPPSARGAHSQARGAGGAGGGDKSSAGENIGLPKVPAQEPPLHRLPSNGNNNIRARDELAGDVALGAPAGNAGWERRLGTPTHFVKSRIKKINRNCTRSVKLTASTRVCVCGC